MTDKVIVFEPFQFQSGQKIYISGGKRRGDWEVISFDGNKLTLRCPVSHVEINVNQFCYFVKEAVQEWPQKHSEGKDG